MPTCTRATSSCRSTIRRIRATPRSTSASSAPCSRAISTTWRRTSSPSSSATTRASPPCTSSPAGCPRSTRVDELESAVRTVCEPIFHKPLKEISFAQVLLRLFETARRFDMQIQPQLILLQKTLLNIEGLGRELYPELDLWKTAQPILKQWMRERMSPRAVLKRARAQLPDTVEALKELPRLFQSAVRAATEGRLQLTGRESGARGAAPRAQAIRQAPRRGARRRRAVAVRLAVAGGRGPVPLVRPGAARGGGVLPRLVSRIEMADQMRIPVESTTSYRGRNARPNWIALLGLDRRGPGGRACSARSSRRRVRPPPRRGTRASSKPPWVIPNSWFGPVWTVLYVMMATAAWLVSRERYHRRQGVALGAYALQLLLNAAWMPLFFARAQPRVRAVRHRRAVAGRRLDDPRILLGAARRRVAPGAVLGCG